MRHHLGLALATAVLCWTLLAILPGTDMTWKWSMSTGYVALACLVATLLIGPFNVLRGRRLALSHDLRRDIGAWAAGLGLVHVVVGLQVHLGSGWLYFLFPPGAAPARWPLPIRIDVFGAANYIGLLATVILIVLLLASNDASMRLLGNARWKRVQQLNYVLLGLVVLHGILYQRIEQRDLGWVLLFAALWLSAAGMQLAGVRVRTSHDRTPGGLASRAQADRVGIHQ